jgi:hypothetical protein
VSLDGSGKAPFAAITKSTGNSSERRMQVHSEAIEQGSVQPPPLDERPTIPYTELPDGTPDSPIASEWSLYRREVGRLLAQGHENRWVLIKGDQIMGMGTPKMPRAPSHSRNT